MRKTYKANKMPKQVIGPIHRDQYGLVHLTPISMSPSPDGIEIECEVIRNPNLWPSHQDNGEHFWSHHVMTKEDRLAFRDCVGESQMGISNALRDMGFGTTQAKICKYEKRDGSNPNLKYLALCIAYGRFYPYTEEDLP